MIHIDEHLWDDKRSTTSRDLEDTSTIEPIAYFQPSNAHKEDNTLEPIPARLYLTERVAEICDIIVISFLFLEKKRRMMSNKSSTFWFPLGYSVEAGGAFCLSVSGR